MQHFKSTFWLLLISICFSLNLGILSNASASGASTCETLFDNFVIHNNDFGLKFTNYFGKFDFEKSPLTTGVEVEAGIPAQFGREDMAELIVNLLKKQKHISKLTKIEAHKIKDKSLGDFIYQVTYKKNNQTYTYVLDEDYTIKCDEGYNPFELKTPILRDAEDLQLFLFIMKSLENELGLKEMPFSGGIHVHIGFLDFTPAELAFLVKVFAAVEKQLVNRFEQLESRTYFAKQTKVELLNYLDSVNPETLEYSKMVELLMRDRDFNLNLEALKSFGTIEFRLFNSSVDSKEIFKMVDFVQKFTIAIRTKNESLIAYLHATKNSDLKLDTVAQIIGVKLN